jgi:hypothetical protein
MSSAAVVPSNPQGQQQVANNKKMLGYLGSLRTSGPEYFFTQALTTPGVTPSTFAIPKFLAMVRPMGFMHFRWKGRIVIGVAAITNISPEAPQNIIQRLTVKGTHASLGNVTLYDGSGATLFAMGRAFGVRGNSVYINGVRQPEFQGGTTVAISGGGASGTGTAATFGATGTYDLEIFYTLPFFPYFVPDSQASLFLLNPAAWGQTINITLYTADQTAFGTQGTATFVFTSFGSGSGAPAVDIYTTFVQLGDFRNSIQQGVVTRNVSPVSSVLTTAGTQVRIIQLQNQRTTAVVLKTGTTLAGTTAGVLSFGTLSESITEQVTIQVDNKLLRNLQNNDMTKEFYGFREETVQPIGYLGIPFDDGTPSNNAFAGYRGDKLPPGAQFNLLGNIANPAGTNTGEVVQEMILGEPVVQGGT